MLSWFKKKDKKDSPALDLKDINGNPLKEGDIVESMRYDLGKCQIILEGSQFIYESLENGEQVSWLRMVDAATSFQKVKRVS